MLQSMTGYGREQLLINGRDITVEIRSVNHRYYEFSSRVPRVYGYLDEKLKSFVKNSVSRGKIEVSVTINNIEGRTAAVSIDRDLALEYLKALREANETLRLEDDVTLSMMTRFSDIFSVQKLAEDEELIWNDVKTAAEKALEKFVEMRRTEGSTLKKDLLEKLKNIENTLGTVEEQTPVTAEKYREKLFKKLKEVLDEKEIDEQRIVTEAALFAEKIAIDEETVRLRSHIAQFRELVESEGPVGRKLDFLVQEFNREINTMGSKAQDVKITKCVVDMKSEVEKIREQIQNIE